MGTIDVRMDIAAFFGYINEKALARESFEGNVVILEGARWILTNIAEILSNEDVVCSVREGRLFVTAA